MKFVSMGASLALLIASAGFASAGSWVFNLENKSESHVTSFRTQENGAWSQNWLSENVAPGETFDMDFGTDEGSCVVRTRIDFTDGTYIDADIDYCDISLITVRNKDVVWK
ncbi:hypothetical protein GWI72_01750 [Microvirga tunisiensis]|uniref:Uncharacterized protein n=2 Tax=Pannonibacter tanglangensis TaxID=2750084 RepID=A0A7X5EZI1_9HYPH|nr:MULTISPECIES: hypothetical protein [unclassified Pannonibacter]NBN63351.1 hypothetical protein [Pannonibacter sp. XCT-34]NBN76986.1 hypothetical protein [Pannonibacter sp. XCT-53]